MKSPVALMLVEYAALVAMLLVVGSHVLPLVAGSTLAPLAEVTRLLR